MTSRNFEAEFSGMMSVLAADDPELVALYRERMYGDTAEGAESPENFMRGLIMVQYDLDPEAYNQAVARCVAKLAGVKLGAEVFRG